MAPTPDSQTRALQSLTLSASPSFREFISAAWGLLQRDFLLHLQIILTIVLSWVALEVLVVSSQSLGGWVNLGLHLAFLVIFSGMLAGYLRIVLAQIQGCPTRYGDLFGALGSGPSFLAGGLGYLALTLFGLLLVVFPGLYWGAKYGFWGYSMVAEGSARGLGFSRSAEITRGARGNLVRYTLFLFLINILGASLLGIGLVVTVPLTVLTYGIVFCHQTMRVAAE